MPLLLTQPLLQRQQEGEVLVPPPGMVTGVPTQAAHPPTFLLPDNVSLFTNPSLRPN